MFDDVIFVCLGIVLGVTCTLCLLYDNHSLEKECVDYYLKNDYVLSYCEEYIEK